MCDFLSMSLSESSYGNSSSKRNTMFFSTFFSVILFLVTHCIITLVHSIYQRRPYKKKN